MGKSIFCGNFRFMTKPERVSIQKKIWKKLSVSYPTQTLYTDIPCHSVRPTNSFNVNMGCIENIKIKPVELLLTALREARNKIGSSLVFAFLASFYLLLLLSVLSQLCRLNLLRNVGVVNNYRYKSDVCQILTFYVIYFDLHTFANQQRK